MYATTAMLHKALILTNRMNEITRACQLTKAGMVNSNLLDREDIDRSGKLAVPKRRRSDRVFSSLNPDERNITLLRLGYD